MKTIFSLLYIGFLLNMNPIFAQTMTIKGKAKVLECKAPFEKVSVDMLNDESNFQQEMSILPTTRIVDKKGNPLKPDNLTAGTEIELIGERINHKNVLREVKVLTKWLGEETKLDGILELWDENSGIAVVDGEKVRLLPGTSIKGKSGLKGRKFGGFSEISLGNYMELEGVRQSDGIVSASDAVVWENNFDATDQELRTALGDQFSAQHLVAIPVPGDL